MSILCSGNLILSHNVPDPLCIYGVCAVHCISDSKFSWWWASVDVAPCGLVCDCQGFGVTCYLQLQVKCLYFSKCKCRSILRDLVVTTKFTSSHHRFVNIYLTCLIAAHDPCSWGWTNCYRRFKSSSSHWRMLRWYLSLFYSLIFYKLGSTAALIRMYRLLNTWN
jgi:hypothetical protein